MKTTTLFLAAAAISAISAIGAANTAPVAKLAVDGKATGKIKLDGAAPTLKPLQITDEKAKGCCPADKKMDMTDPSVVVGKDGGIANVVVMIEVPGEKMEPRRSRRDRPEDVPLRAASRGPGRRKVVFLNSERRQPQHPHVREQERRFNKTVAPGSRRCTLAKATRCR
jgi:hypothetical protein